MKPLKKCAALSLTLFLCLSCLLVPASASEIVGESFNTYTYAFINTDAIPLYTYNNYPYIIAEDLAGYGFHKKWVETEQTLYLYYDASIDWNSYDDVFPSSGKAYDVYSSDIRVVLNGGEVPCFSVGGMTLIAFDSLWSLGEVVYLDALNITYVTTPWFRENNPDWRNLMPLVTATEKIRNVYNMIWDARSEFADDINYAIDDPSIRWSGVCNFGYSLHYDTNAKLKELRAQLEVDYQRIINQPDFFMKPTIAKTLKELASYCSGQIDAFEYAASVPLNLSRMTADDYYSILTRKRQPGEYYEVLAETLRAEFRKYVEPTT